MPVDNSFMQCSNARSMTDTLKLVDTTIPSHHVRSHLPKEAKFLSTSLSLALETKDTSVKKRNVYSLFNGCTHIIEMFGGFHNVGCSLVLLRFHPTLTKKFPA